MPEDFPIYASAIAVVSLIGIVGFRKELVILLGVLYRHLGSLTSWLTIAYCRLGLWWWNAWGYRAYENHQGRIFYAAFGFEACHNPDVEAKQRVRSRLLQATQLFNDIRHHPLGGGKGSILTGLEYKLNKCIDEPEMGQLLTSAVAAAHHFGYISQSQAQWMHHHRTPATTPEDLFGLPHLMVVVNNSPVHRS